MGINPDDKTWPDTSVTRMIFYEKPDRTQMPAAQPGPNAYNNYCGNDLSSQTMSAYRLSPDEPDGTEKLPVELHLNGLSSLRYVANRRFRVNCGDLHLLNAGDADYQFPNIQNIRGCGGNSSPHFIIQNTKFRPHPIHIHGHDFRVLREGLFEDKETSFPHGQPEFSRVLPGRGF
ncbi:hypothetical protein F5Y00DRAFT_264858 [Daldinia vernicosa]|uniref:uncharacterized protein n=1 Tax=Daldinia vernicosa TaxID=114800 RepID=UPI002007E1FD|nr:uncharacterized protein F5Y00DRAFT_264858 [Daldinia vernicosa]KAI0846140.1 hypothetical protein F5Y00DRAFT_264858 [Daldinia vernicosa]